jgi:1-phosphofructokinase/tagatose 6-phosphate kinase
MIDGQRRRKRARVELREPIAKRGSGDALLAGYLAARYEGRAPDQCIRFGVACGAESTARLGAGLIDAREARRLMGDVELSEVDLAEVT